MINPTDKTKCCGCAACAQICPRQCITMQADTEGFLYPHVSPADCINCGLCEEICPELHPWPGNEHLSVYAAINTDEQVRLQSSSGGIFHLLAQSTIAAGGVVFGVRFDNNWQAITDFAEDMEGIKAFMGSKYIQASTGTAFRDARQFLDQGRKVLFTGTPCQIAGLKHFLRKDYDNLLTVEIVCHGAPSPKVWDKYLKEICDTAARIKSIGFRDKSNGWKKFNFVFSYDKDGTGFTACSYHHNNHFMRAFLSNLILRPSCQQCTAKLGRSRSDLSIADFWGVRRTLPDMDDDKGTSLIIVNTEKGRQAIHWQSLRYTQSTLEDALPGNGGLYAEARFHPKRAQFFARLDSAKSLTALIDRTLQPPLKQRIIIALVNLKSILTSALTNLRHPLASIFGGG